MMSDKRIYIRAATGHDGEKLRAMFSRSSPETIYRRFHIPYPAVPEWMMAFMLGSDHHDKEVLVAVAEEKVVGHAMYVRLDAQREAEMAIGCGASFSIRCMGRKIADVESLQR